MKARIPETEVERLEDLHSYRILDTPEEDAYNDLVTLAAEVTQAPYVLISLVDECRQWFKAKLGVQESETHRDVAFCAHAILQTDPLVVEDATLDPRFSDNPLVTGPMNVRFYAGVPLISGDGHALGTLCVIDTKPRSISEFQLRSLGMVARQVVAQLSLRRLLFAQQKQVAETLLSRQTALEQQQTLQSFFDASDNLMGVFEIRSRKAYFLSSNQALQRAFGIKASSQAAHAIDDIAPELGKQQLIASAEEAFSRRRPVTFVSFSTTLEGSRAYSVTINNIGQSSQGFPQFSYSATDISEELESLKTRSRLANALETTSDLVLSIDLKSEGIIYSNRSIRDVCGPLLKVGEHRSTFADLQPEDEAQRIRLQAIPLAVAKGTWSGETKVLGLNNTLVPVSLVIVANPEPTTGEVSYVSLIMRDQRRQKSLENRLEVLSFIDHSFVMVQASDSLESFVAQMLREVCERFELEIGICWLTDPDSNHCKLLAASDSIVTPASKKFIELSQEIAKSKEIWAWKEALTQNKSIMLTQLGKHVDFTRREMAKEAGYQLGIVTPIWSDGHAIGVLEFYSKNEHWITLNWKETVEAIADRLGSYIEKKQVEDELRLSSERIRQTLEGALDAVLTVDAEGRITEWNRQAEQVLGWTKSEAIGAKLTNLIVPPAFRAAHEGGFHRFLATREARILNRRVEVPALRKDGVEIAVELTVTPVQTKRGLIFSAFVRDLTEQKAIAKTVEDQRLKLLSSARLSALGEMAAGVAHEINNPLAILRAKTQLLRRAAQRQQVTPESVVETTHKLEETIVRIAKIISGLRTFARDGERDSVEDCSLQKIIDDTLEFCRTRFHNHNVSLSWEGIPNELLVSVRPVQIGQVLLNLLNNAFDAISSQEEPWVRIEAQVESEDWVSISVTDSGHGISAELREKIMQPFFTTKEVGKGTGLGLSLSKGIIESHGGKLMLDTESRETRFIFSLPRAKAAAKPLAS